MTLHIAEDDLSDGRIINLLNEHLQQMHRFSPPESIHALDTESLKHPSMTFWSATIDNRFSGCGALKQLTPETGEIKSMKTADHALRQGVAAGLLQTIIAEASRRGYQTLSLETGTHDAFLPAIRLYEQYGFKECAPFADYQPDPHSRFLSLRLSEQSTD